MLTLEQYKLAHPNEHRAIILIAANDVGGVHTEYYQGNTDIGAMGKAVKDYVYINGWTVSFKEIVVV